MSVGGNIKTIRMNKGLSLRALALKAGISKSTLSDIENENTNPTTTSLEKLAAALEVKVDEFFKTEPISEDQLNAWDKEYNSNELAEEIKEAELKYNSKITDVKKAMEMILSQPGLMLNGEMLSDESKIALANAIQMGLAYAEQMQKKERK